MTAQLIVIPPPETVPISFLNSQPTALVMQYNQYGTAIPSNSYVNLSSTTTSAMIGTESLRCHFDFYGDGYNTKQRDNFIDSIANVLVSDFSRSFASISKVRDWISANCIQDVIAYRTSWTYTFCFIDGMETRNAFNKWAEQEKQARTFNLKAITMGRFKEITDWIADNYGEDCGCISSYDARQTAFWCPDPDMILTLKMRWDGPDEVAV